MSLLAEITPLEEAVGCDRKAAKCLDNTEPNEALTIENAPAPEQAAQEEQTPEKETAAPTPDETSEKPKKKKKKRSAGSYAVELALKLGLTALAVWLLCSFVIGVFVCHTNSGYPMVKDGDLCITWRLGELEQGSEVAFEHDGKTRFARVIAKAGDEVNIAGGTVMVNGYVALTDTVYDTPNEGSSITYPYIVPEGTVFLLNDFREDMSDSRSFGGVQLSDCKGKVVFVMRRRGI